MPGFTHLKNAQPVSFAHYLMAYLEMFNRDKKRFDNNLDILNESPLGVAALTGTSFKIDRFYTSKKLGFQRPTKNSIDTVSDRDFVLIFLYSCLHAQFTFLELLRSLLFGIQMLLNLLN